MSEPKDKFELRDYLKNLDLNNYGLLRDKSAEILRSVRRVMGPYLERPDTDHLKHYYEGAVKKIEKSHQSRDLKQFSDALDFLIASIDWE